MTTDSMIRLLKKMIAALKKSKTATSSGVRLILTVWQRGLLAEDWSQRIDGFDAVSIKCVDGPKAYRMDEAKKTALEALAAEVEVEAWGFHYCLTETQARKEARVAAKACLELGAVGYHWNAEKQWAGGGDPPSAGAAFAQEFKVNAPDVKLYANCFKDQATTIMLTYFDVFEPMCYGTKRRTIAIKIKNRMERMDIPASKRGIMVGTGRLDAGKPGRAWGYISGDGTSPGLLQLASRHRPVVINFFRAGKANGEDIMLEGNDVNPSLTEQAQGIRASLDGAVV